MTRAAKLSTAFSNPSLHDTLRSTDRIGLKIVYTCTSNLQSVCLIDVIGCWFFHAMGYLAIASGSFEKKGVLRPVRQIRWVSSCQHTFCHFSMSPSRTYLHKPMYLALEQYFDTECFFLVGCSLNADHTRAPVLGSPLPPSPSSFR